MPATATTSRHTALFATGTGLWALALAILAIGEATHVHDAGDWVWVCVAGIVLGIVGVCYAHVSWRAR
ncbi:MAG: DUF2530 domain-containing protein [Bifidobacteriaceae bacterium]|jgi:hypothetical protein|nr:DUF2530 domain-containing protein [Bifidobacteriaceae bacterium]